MSKGDSSQLIENIYKKHTANIHNCERQNSFPFNMRNKSGMSDLNNAIQRRTGSLPVQ